MSTIALPKVTLYCTLGGSDKVYCLEIAASGSGFVVNFANGKRTGTLQTGTKTTSPVTMEAAQKIYDKVYREKTGKGYTEGEGDRAFTGTDKAGRVSGLLPQLSREISREEMEALILDPGYMFEEKKDGNRVMIRKDGSTVEAINRTGLTIGFPKEVETEISTLGGKLILDGEMVGDTFWAFDCLFSPMEGDITGKDAEGRLGSLLSVVSVLDGFSTGGLKNVAAIKAAFTTKDKRELFDRMEREGREGVIAKLISASYEAGRPAKGGPSVKFKFRDSATVIVKKVNLQRSVGMCVLDETGAEVEIGNVTIPANQAIPAPGDLIEVTYRHANRGGSLIEPSYCGPRTDIARAEATLDQLKFKAE
jgi:bifunctional non-homologous end joining protein LigD